MEAAQETVDFLYSASRMPFIRHRPEPFSWELRTGAPRPGQLWHHHASRKTLCAIWPFTST